MSFKKNDIFMLLSGIILLASCQSKKAEKNEVTTGLSIPKEINQVVGVGRVLPLHGLVDLAVEEGGIVQSVEKEEGDSVKKGEVIIVLNTSEASLKRQQTVRQINVQQQQNNADELNIQQLDIQLNSLLKKMKTSEQLVGKGAETKENLDALYTDRDVLESQIVQNKKMLAVGQAKIKELQTQLAISENALGKGVVKAPSDGILLTQKAKVGAAVHALEAFANFAPASPLIVDAEVDEMFANRLSVGQKVTVHYMGHDTTIATGEISSLSPDLSNKSQFSDEPAEKQDRRVRRIKIQLDSHAGLLINSKVECNIQIQ